MKTIIASALALMFTSLTSHAAASWIDWQTKNSGTLTIGGNSIGVTLSGPAMDLVNGDYYYNNGATGGTSAGGTYGGLAPSDLIRVSGTGTFTLTFDQAIVDPYIALVSVGQPGLGVSYNFGSDYTLISKGGNYWGYNGYTEAGNSFIGREFNGVLQFDGTFSSLTFSVGNPEFWHGFNVGAVAAVPEPETYAMLLGGLGLVALARRRRAA